MESFYLSIYEDYTYSHYPMILKPSGKYDSENISHSRSNIFGYTHHFFINLLKNRDIPVVITDQISISTIGKTHPFEPEIAIIDAEKGLFIDLEIDVPYHEYYRFPMNCYSKNVVTGNIFNYNKNRDDFFRRNGWFVIRFSEKQIFEQPDNCISFIKNFLSELNNNSYDKLYIEKEKCWSLSEAAMMEKEYVRENYLNIQNFNKPKYIDSVVDEVRASLPSEFRPTIVFNEENHTYFDERDQSGAANYISVTTLIEKFFPHFDEEAYIEKYIAEGNTREHVIEKMTIPSKIGTHIHEQIEFYLKGLEHNEDSKEFKLFLNFYNEQILRRGLDFYDAEKKIILPRYNIAGTVDALFKKSNGEYVMVDWKRSKKLIINGFPKKYGYGNGFSILSHLDNSSYYHYELQQSMYKYILEREYAIRISSMILCVLHEDYDKYYTIRLSNYREKEVVEMIAAHTICNR